MGSNPTPRVTNKGSKGTNKNKESKVISETFSEKEMTLLNIPETREINKSYNGNNDNNYYSSKSLELERKIDSITRSLSKPYFNKILKLKAEQREAADILQEFSIGTPVILQIKEMIEKSEEKNYELRSQIREFERKEVTI